MNRTMHGSNGLSINKNNMNKLHVKLPDSHDVEQRATKKPAPVSLFNHHIKEKVYYDGMFIFV